MQKKLLAVAVAGALGAPAVAFAQASTVQIYGNMNIEYAYADQGAGREKVDAFNSPGSAIGFKGEEKLGGGMSAWFQCESTADTGGNSGGASNGVFCSRNSAIGLKGAFGNVFLGTWDTPFKRTMGPNIVGANQTGFWGVAEILSSNATTVHDNSNRNVFLRRQRNSVNYDTPVFGGFQAHLAWGTTNNSTGVVAPGPKARVFSLGASYKNGPLFVGAGYEAHNEFAPLAAGFADDKGWHIGANYTFMGKVKVGGLFTRQEFQSTNNLGDVEYDAWHVGVEWALGGPHSILASYSSVDDADGALGALGPGQPRPNAGPNTGADMWTIRYKHAFSKRTAIYLGYSRVDNEAAASYRLTPLVRPNAGQDQSAWGININHRF